MPHFERVIPVEAVPGAGPATSGPHSHTPGRRSVPQQGTIKAETPPSQPKTTTPGLTSNSTLDHAIHKLASDDFTRLLCALEYFVEGALLVTLSPA